MNTNKGSWLSRNKWILVLIGVPAGKAVHQPEGERDGASRVELGAGSAVHRKAGREDSSDQRTSDDLQEQRWQRILAAFGFHDFERARRTCGSGASGRQGTGTGDCDGRA